VVKDWWSINNNGKFNVIVNYRIKFLEFEKGNNTIALDAEAYVTDILRKVRATLEAGELDALSSKRLLKECLLEISC
jgi:hypothetical protein